MSSHEVIQDNRTPTWLLFLGLIISPVVIATFVSLFMHGMLFLILYLTPSAETGDTVAVEKAMVAPPEEKPVDLTVTDVGDNPEIAPMPLEPKQNLPPEVPEAPMEVEKAAENLPMNLTPPPGVGASGEAPPAMDLGAATGVASLAGQGGIYAPGGVGGRVGQAKADLLKEQGGNPESEVCVAMGLKWLALHQANDGRWSLNEFHKHARTAPLPGGQVIQCNCQNRGNRSDDIAGTGLGLLPFLGAGITHKPPRDKSETDYSKSVLAGLNFLMKRQNKEGAFATGHGSTYSHAIATMAVCEAFGLTNDPLLKQSAQKGLDYLFATQDPAGGGWRYQPREAGDLSVTGWVLMAIKSGQMAGLRVNSQRMKLMEKFVESCQDPKSKGSFYYMPSEPGNITTMTSVGMLCRLYLGVRPVNAEMQAGAAKLKQTGPGKTNDIYYLYYATQAMHHMGPTAGSWKFWNEGEDGSGRNGIRNYFVARQYGGPRSPTANNAHQKGSFFIGTTPGTISDNEGGRLMHTSLALLSLEVYYRHLPLYRRELAAGN